MTIDFAEERPRARREVRLGERAGAAAIVPRARALRRRLVFLVGDRAAAWARLDAMRLPLWSPVAVGLGAGLYFGLRAEPPWQIAAAVLAAATLAAALAPRWRAAAAAVALCALGFVAADWRTERVGAPALDRDIGIVDITGRLLAVEENASRRRLLIALETVEGLDPGALPARARVTWRGKDFDAAPGDRVSLSAGLGPPPPPAFPGGFDFARRLYFQKIGAVGYAVSAPAVDDAAPKTRAQRLAARIETLRLGLFRRIVEAAPNEGGAIVAAVVTGKRDAITQRAEAALRDTGLAHLLAISGLHMGLATGLIFFAVRFGLALAPPLALNFPIKKWAALAALVAGALYLILSGGGWSARRAFIMTAIIFAAILVDRRALSLRNVAVAAVVILLTTPEALFQPGFQMSFAAVTALIAAYEWSSRRADPFRSFEWPARVRRYAVGLAATDTIAALATAPYALYHFNRVALYSLPANMAAMPLMGFWIMPAAVLALLLTPFGLDAWAWRLSAAGMETTLAIASEVAGWRGAVSATPQWPLGAMLVLTFGGLWLCLSQAPWRLAGLAAIPAAALMIASVQPPTAFVASSGRNAGLILPAAESRDDEINQRLAMYSTRRDRFAATMWTEAAGFDPARIKPLKMRDIFPCDARGCAVILPSGVKMSFVEDRAALDEDCARADVVVAFFPASPADWRACDAVLIDRRSVWRRGAHTVRIDEAGAVTVRTADDVRGARPWTGD